MDVYVYGDDFQGQLNCYRGKRKLADGESHEKEPVQKSVDDESPDKKECKKRWAALIQKVYEIDPQECPRCGSQMRIMAFIDQWKTILRILKHLELWPPS